MEEKRTVAGLQQLQALPLELKIKMTKQRIRDWVEYYGEDGVYVSFSGGKDSTVLLHLVREMYPGIPAVFFDTGLEYPEIRKFARSFQNVEFIKPKKTFKEVINHYGYPMISKQVADVVDNSKKHFEQFYSEYISGGARLVKENIYIQKT